MRGHHAEQDNSLPLVTVEAKFFTEKRPSGYGGCTYADELELSFEITLADMAGDGDEPQQAWLALIDPSGGEDLGIPLLGVLDRILDGRVGPKICDFTSVANQQHLSDVSHYFQHSCDAYR